MQENKSPKEFMLKESTGETIVNWGCLPIVDVVKEYLKTHKYPKDKEYPENTFLEDVEKADMDSYISLWVEKEETAEFIEQLCYDLI